MGRAGQRIGKVARGPDRQPAEIQAALRPGRQAGRYLAAAGDGQAGKRRRHGPVVRVLGQHGAGEVGDNGGQPDIAGEGGETSKFKLAADDGVVVHAGQRVAAEGKHHQRHAQRIDVVRNPALAAPGAVAHDGIRRFVQRRLEATRRRRPGRAEHHAVAAAIAEQVANADGVMGEAGLLQPVQGGGGRAQQHGQQVGFTPGRRTVSVKPSARRRRVDGEQRRLPVRTGGGAMRDRTKHPLDRRILQRGHGQGARRQVPRAADRHQFFPPVRQVGGAERGQAADLAQNLPRLDHVQIGDGPVRRAKPVRLRRVRRGTVEVRCGHFVRLDPAAAVSVRRQMSPERKAGP